MELPKFWRSNLNDIDEIVSTVKKGRVTETLSPGGRKIYLVEYGEANDYSYRTANFNSAAGAHDITCYADKSREGTKPCVFLIGAMHGAEFEGTVAILNLISLIETGVDLAGERYPAFEGIEEKMHLLLVPCANPDGRARVPVDAFAETSEPEFRKWAQGTWKKDGSLANWPMCKKVHPIKEASDFLGSYFDDNGINLMHDDFFNPWSETTKFLLRIADKHVPDVTSLLHGGGSSKMHIPKVNFVPYYYNEQAYKIMLRLSERCRRNGLEFAKNKYVTVENEQNVTFNAVSAFIAKCGTVCFTYESNQGIGGGKLCYPLDVIYKHHMLLFEECFDYAAEAVANAQKNRK